MYEYQRTVDAITATKEVPLLIEDIVYEAFLYWERANRESDFCLQLFDPGMGVIVFGSTNRVQWSVRHGFRILEGYCTAHFLEANEGY